jgi:hypothetical protein
VTGEQPYPGSTAVTRYSRGCAVAPLGIGIQAIQPLPYRTGLAGLHLQRVPVPPAFLACSFPLWFSPSGEPDDPEAFLYTPPVCNRDSARRTTTHTFAAHSSSTDTPRVTGAGRVSVATTFTVFKVAHVHPQRRCRAAPVAQGYSHATEHPVDITCLFRVIQHHVWKAARFPVG